MSDIDDELFDVVDERNRVVGTAPRSACHGDPSLAHRAVHLFVIDAAGRYFLQRRAASKRIQPGRWDTSVGGHLNPGEGYRQAAVRECREELGIELDPAAVDHLHDYVWRTEIETEHISTFRTFHEGPFTLHPEEIDEGRFCSRDELLNMRQSGVLTPNLEDELRRLGVF